MDYNNDRHAHEDEMQPDADELHNVDEISHEELEEADKLLESLTVNDSLGTSLRQAGSYVLSGFRGKLPRAMQRHEKL